MTTIAPTGSIGLIADRSPDIEPIYGVQEVRRIMDGFVLTSVHPAFVRRALVLGLNLTSLQPDLVAHPSIQHVPHIPDELRRLFVTAHDVSPEHHVRMQAVFQRYSDSESQKPSISRPRRSKSTWLAVFLLAYQLGCKGLTVFRTGSRERKFCPAAPPIPVDLLCSYAEFFTPIDTTRRW